MVNSLHSSPAPLAFPTTPPVSKSAFYWRLFIFQQFSTHQRGGGCRGWRKRDQGDHDGEYVVFVTTHPSSSSILFLQGISRDIRSVDADGVHVISLLPYVSLWRRTGWLLSIRKLCEGCHHHGKVMTSSLWDILCQSHHGIQGLLNTLNMFILRDRGKWEENRT